MDIYIKPVEKIEIVGRKLVLLKDIGEILVGGQTEADVGSIVVFQVPKDGTDNYLISVMDVIKAITNHLPDATVSNVGEMDILVEYSPIAKKPSIPLMYLKVAFVFIVLLAGSATAIMSFHTDSEIPKVFENYYYIFFGENKDMPAILSIPYSLGLGLGIIVFFNHFSKFYVTNDPTPIEVQMTTYEKETTASVVDALNKESKQKSGDKL